MFHRLLPITVLIFMGCTKDPVPTTETAQATINGTVQKLKTTCIVCHSDDKGNTWNPNDAGLPANVEVRRMAKQGERLIITTSEHGMFISDVERQHWQPLSTGQMPSKDIVAMVADEGSIYVTVKKLGVFATHDEGKHWTKLNENPIDDGDFIHAIFKVGDELWAAYQGSLYAMPEAPMSQWREVMKGVFATNLAQSGQNILLGTSVGIALSNDGGQHWEWVSKHGTVRKLVAVGSQIVAIFQERDAMVSADAGKTWNPVQSSDSNASSLLSTVKAGHDMHAEQDGIYSRWGDASLNFFGLSDYAETDFLPVGNAVYMWVLGRMDGC